MRPLIRAVDTRGLTPVTPEWLVANGLGGFSSGTVLGPPARRYHGLLVAALPAPIGRSVMVNHLGESVASPGGDGFELAQSDGSRPVDRFFLEDGLPVWHFRALGMHLEKRIVMPHGQNTVHAIYRLHEGSPCTLRLRPHIAFRRLEAPVSGLLVQDYRLEACGDRFEISHSADWPVLRMRGGNARWQFVYDHREPFIFRFPTEAARGYESDGALWSPGYFEVRMSPGECCTLTCSTEPWSTLQAHDPGQSLDAERDRRVRLVEQANVPEGDSLMAELVLAADQFMITPAAARVEETARARAAGDDVRTVIAGYHWFTDWGRDTMISLEGLALCTGRHAEAGYLLRTFAQYIRDGLIPNLFPEGTREGLYHTADATLWYFHALARYLGATNDRQTLRAVLPRLLDIVRHHIHGTRFGIGVDPHDGLLRAGAEGYQLTWMDAKVGDWVVTPRRGKPVEINALWYNALRWTARWCAEEGDAGATADLTDRANRACRSFNDRFWNEDAGFLFDVVDGENGNDPACRPNQLFSISLDHTVLDAQRWAQVVNTVGNRLLTPFGLRTLSRDHPDYKASYDGDLRSRDAAYHQGTVWPWLIGPFVDAWMKVHPRDREGARRLLENFRNHLSEDGVGSISEVFDAEPPWRPRGCIAQAWSVAEALRSLRATAG